MRFVALAMLPIGLSAGCAGNVADYIGPRAPIITPQLARFGLDATQTQCVGLRLGSSLTPLQLRQFARQASVVEQSFFATPTLTARDLTYVATHMSDPRIAPALASGLEECTVSTTDDPAAGERTEGRTGTPAVAESPRGPTWLNLGAATSGQAIAVDATSLQQEDVFRTAWFRLTNPGANAATGLTYLLRLDCSARTISPQADRRVDAEGNVTENREYSPEERGPLPIEGGTVMEIAFLSLCT